ncbi:DNA-directed RNA polymerase, subunit H, RpoH/RPB5 [Aciduliprofundum sp. MAR08-339]|uniref:DNA-directed RNA polymerase subunit H n=1 Tax=Aciduliprofundum sp. (strain MAR08-339) TaxID=673860 RepID=UPI0002A488DD|nr:DNA-directed RNA polymerase, subunit H, RpoH/RPB5 [Aciduliprofundum sp. MAR08-339]
MVRFNVLEHELVPEHYLVSEEEEEKILNELGVKKENLPKIKKSDAVLRVLERKYGHIPVGSLIKIVRKSPTAGRVVVYRVVVRD